MFELLEEVRNVGAFRDELAEVIEDSKGLGFSPNLVGAGRVEKPDG